ncbi:hypothetical protein I6I06_07070 [Paraburkholderia ginsengisoli]|uniref:Uncharacterized protein n=1 Tax=Paraburkholderia ginsengisoli TaxID=311231 RepID=A0A7T4N599_9BURK|nr:hypothetical protein I6I06_07070 [Paraburkholderia ginsengisoli]
MPADRRPDGTVRVWRHQLASMALPEAERLRPKLRPIRKINAASGSA